MITKTFSQQAWLQQHKEQSVLVGTWNKSPQQQEGESNDPNAPAGGPEGGTQGEPKDVEFQSPFNGVDRSLLDDQTRSVIDKAEAQMKTMHGQVKSVSKIQSEKDQYANAIKNYETEVARLQSLQNPGHQQQQQRELTLEEEFEKTLIEEHKMDPAGAKIAAKAQARLHEISAKRLQEQMGRRMAPIVGKVIDQGLTTAFEDASQGEYADLFQSETVSEAVWKQLNDVASKGGNVTPELAVNLAKMYYVDEVRSGKAIPPSEPPKRPMNGNGNMTTRHTYPGAGTMARRAPSAQPTEQYDADTYAAMLATSSSWPVQPAAFKGKADPNKIRITRGEG